MDKQPPRLIDDPAASAALRADMEHARSEHRGEATAYDVIAGAAALEAALAASTAAAGTAGSTSATSAAQLGGWTKAVLGVVGASMLVLSGAGLHALLQARMQQAPVASAAAQPLTAPSAPPPVEARPSVAMPALPSPAVPSAPHAASTEPRKATPALAEGEARQLARIRALLHAGDATRALALAERGQRERGDGGLWQERQALSVLALLALDRSAEAETRARELLSRYPDSPFRAEIEQRLREADAR